MNSRIQVTPDRDPNRIEVFCKIPGWPGEQLVISLVRRGDTWTVGSSMSLLSNLEQAMAIQDCYSKAFEALANVKRGSGYCVTMSREKDSDFGQKPKQQEG